MKLFQRKSQNAEESQNSGITSHWLWYGIGIYIIVFSVLSILKYESFAASVYDLGIMIQTIWNTSKGWILQESINMGYPMMRFWMAHWEFIYLPVALIYKIFPSPYTILIIQTIVIALGALPVYWLAREKLNDSKVALIFAAGYLLHPAIQNANLCDVHGVTFAATFLMFSFYYLQNKRFVKFIIFGALALLSREDAALVLFMMGLYTFFIMKDKKKGLIIAAVSLAWFLIWYKRMTIRAWLGLPDFVIMEGAEAHWDHLKNISSDPLYLIKFLAKKYNIRYFFYLFGPMALVSFLSPTHLLIASPILAINLLSSYYYTHEVEHYYSVIIAGFVVVSAIYGLKNISDYIAKRGIKLRYVAYVILLYSLFFFFIKSNVFDFRKWEITEHHKVIKDVISSIPEEASVSAENGLAVQVAERREIYVFDDNVGKVDYILYDFYASSISIFTRSSFVFPLYWPDNERIREIMRDPSYGIVKFVDGVCLFKKGADHEYGIRLLHHAVNEDIGIVLNKEISPGIYCKGYSTFNVLRYFTQPDKLGAIIWKRAIHFSTYWSVKELISNDLRMYIRFQNEDMVFEKEHDPVFGLHPIRDWDGNELIRDEVYWEIPEEAAKGMYHVYIAIANDSEDADYHYCFNIEVD